MDKSANGPAANRPNPPISTPLGPSMMLPLRFVLAGFVALGGGMVALALRPELLSTYHYTQYTVAVTHLMTLGWILTVIMGASYQLAPVALEIRLYSERLARWQFLCHSVGVAGMVWSLWIWDMKTVGHFGSLVGLGIGFYVYNLGRTLARAWRGNIVGWAIACGLFWLLMSLMSGLYLAADKCWNFNWFYVMAQIHAHAHLGAVGFFMTMIIGVSYKLVPMFALSEVQSPRRAAVALALLNLGLVVTFFTILFQSRWRLAGVSLLASALVVYGWEIRAILSARKRRELDWGLRYFLTALAGLGPVSILGLILVWPGLPATGLTTQLETVYGLLGLLGVVTLAILGMLYKIVPFLVWYHRYGALVGRAKVPVLSEMYSTRLQALGYWTFLIGLAAIAVSTALGTAPGVQLSCLGLGLSLALFAVNQGKILSHLWKPQIKPLVLSHLKTVPC